MATPNGELTEADLLAAQVAEDEEITESDLFAAQQAEIAEELERRKREAEAKRASEPIQIEPHEATINSAANNVPFGRPLVDVSSAISLAAARPLGRVLPDALARRLPGVVAGPGAVLTPQARAELAAMGEEVPQEPSPADEPGPVDVYRNTRDLRRARTELGDIQRPLSSALGTGLGVGLSIAAPGLAFKAAPGASIFGRALAAGKTGLAQGALAGLTDGAADLTRPSEATAMQAGADVLRGGVTGGAFGLGTGFAIPIARAFWQGAIKPTAAALYLRSKGVPLSTGQLNPKSWFSQIEESVTSVPVTGTAIADIRDEATDGFQRAVLNEARAPGMGRLDDELDHGEVLDEIRKGFNAAYAPAKGLNFEPRTSSGAPLLERPPRQPAPPLPTPANAQPPPTPAPAPAAPRAPAGLGDFKQGKDGKWRDPRGRFVPLEKLPPELRPQPAPKAPDASPEFGPSEGIPAFSAVVEDQSVAVSDKARGIAKRFLDNQLTVLGDEAAKTGVASSDRLIKMRSNIREEIRQHQNGDSDSKGIARLLTRAEQELTDAIDGGLPDDARKAVKEADAQYAKYKTAERAVAAAGDMPDGFTPAQFSRAVRQGREIGEYARGGGGEMRSLAAAGRSVLDARVPKTGARLLAALPGASMFALAGNLPGPQRFLTGQTRAQQAGQSIEAALSNVLRRTPHEAAARAALPEPERPMMSPASAAQLDSIRPPLTEEQRKQLALSEAIRRMQGGRR